MILLLLTLFKTKFYWLIGETSGKIDFGISLGEAIIVNHDFDNEVTFADLLEILVLEHAKS